MEKKERRRNPQAPYTTSKLQQDASSRLGFNVRRTMGVAQRLYEGVEIGDGGHGRSDYVYAYRLDACDVRMRLRRRASISASWARQYLPATPNEYAGKKQEQAQDAHEAIRPTNVAYTPESIRQVSVAMSSSGCTG